MADYSFADPSELAAFLGTTVDTARATMLLDMVADLIVDVAGIRDEYPAVLRIVAITAAARAYTNPLGSDSQTAGGVSLRIPGGVFLTAGEILACRSGLNAVYTIPLRHTTDGLVDDL